MDSNWNAAEMGNALARDIGQGVSLELALSGNPHTSRLTPRRHHLQIGSGSFPDGDTSHILQPLGMRITSLVISLFLVERPVKDELQRAVGSLRDQSDRFI